MTSGSTLSRRARSRGMLAARRCQQGRLALRGGLLLVAALLSLAALAGLAWRGGLAEGPLRAAGAATAGAAPAPSGPATPAMLARGEQLARAGNCLACHSRPGQPVASGGLGVNTPFGTLYTSNLTPDRRHGLGAWDEADFLRALRQGISRDGRLLYPAFPYPHYQRITDEDGRALWAWLRSLPAAPQATPAPALGWPYRTQWALAIWRGLYFQPASLKPSTAQTAAWNRGAYLVQGPGHCGACHDSRNALGAARQPGALDGEFLPGSGWWAPSLSDPAQGGVQDWPLAQVQQWLKTGQAPAGRANGPMAEVVRHSTQHLPDEDLLAMATYLHSLPRPSSPAIRLTAAPNAPLPQAGRRLYEQHCADCHGDQGQGAAGVYPALAGNRLLAQADPGNLALVVMKGGFELATAERPRPYGMPPYGPLLNDAELADLLSYLRAAWGHQAGAVDAVVVNRLRSSR